MGCPRGSNEKPYQAHRSAILNCLWYKQIVESLGLSQHPSSCPFRSKPDSLKHAVSGPLGICSISNLTVVPPGAKNRVHWLHERAWIAPDQASSAFWRVSCEELKGHWWGKRSEHWGKSGVGFILPVAYSLACDPVFGQSGFTTWQRIQFCSTFTRRGQYE